MISMKGVADWTEGQVEVGEEEFDFNAFGKKKTVKNCLYFYQCVNAETHNFVIDHQHTAEMFTQPAVNIRIDLYSTLIIYGKQLLTWVE